MSAALTLSDEHWSAHVHPMTGSIGPGQCHLSDCGKPSERTFQAGDWRIELHSGHLATEAVTTLPRPLCGDHFADYILQLVTPTCGDLLDQDGWYGRCSRDHGHEDRHSGICVRADQSEVADLEWAEQ